MALYVIRPDAPNVGTDWQYEVPGQYVENITGVYATLRTGGATSFIMRDTSPNNVNGHYDVPPNGAAPIIYPIPSSEFPGGENERGLVDDAVIDWTGSFAVECWLRPESANNFRWFGAQNGILDTDLPQIEYRILATGALAAQVLQSGGMNAFWSSDPAAFPFDGDVHQIVIEWDAASGAFVGYVDGAPHTMLPAFTAPFTFGTIDHVAIGGAYPVTPPTFPFGAGLCSLYDHVLGPAAVAAHYAARTNGNVYVTAVLADSPGGFYELADQGGDAGGRQVALAITNSNNDVVKVPSGFDVVDTPGPFAWSWLPNLAAASRTPDGTVTTVPIPRLILPAGYTVGTVTPDLEPTDQWGDISIWWNSDVQDASRGVNPYAYPPGATLVYRQTKGAP